MSVALLQLRAARVVYANGLVAVDGISLDVERGEIHALVGESGSGKTTLAKSAIGLVPLASGEARIAADRIATMSVLDLRRRAQIVFQDPFASLSPRFTLRALLEEPAAIHALDAVEHRERVTELCRRLGIAEELLSKYPHQISGGQARRVGVVRALSLGPDLLVADEPTAGLDVSVQGELLNLLRELNRQSGLALLLVTHNLAVVRRIARRTSVMYLGRIVESGPTRSIFAAPTHPYTAALASAAPVIDPERTRPRLVLRGEIPSALNPPPGCRFHTRCPSAAARCRVESPVLAPRVGGGKVACHFPLNAG
jgi:peptide/nickel transport system ATP-binding protein